MRAKGLPIYGQTGTIRTGFAFTLEHWNLYDASPAWRELTTGTTKEKLAKMQNPALREAVKREAEEADRRLQVIQAGVGGSIPGLLVQSDGGKPALEKYVGKSLGQIAQEEGKTPIDVMLDLSLASELKVEFLGPNKGFNAQYMAEMINDSDYTFPGVSDGGDTRNSSRVAHSQPTSWLVGPGRAADHVGRGTLSVIRAASQSCGLR